MFVLQLKIALSKIPALSARHSVNTLWRLNKIPFPVRRSQWASDGERLKWLRKLLLKPRIVASLSQSPFRGPQGWIEKNGTARSADNTWQPRRLCTTYFYFIHVLLLCSKMAEPLAIPKVTSSFYWIIVL